MEKSDASGNPQPKFENLIWYEKSVSPMRHHQPRFNSLGRTVCVRKVRELSCEAKITGMTLRCGIVYQAPS